MGAAWRAQEVSQALDEGAVQAGGEAAIEGREGDLDGAGESSRRRFFAASLASSAALTLAPAVATRALAAPPAAAAPMYVFVGTYTTNNRADGIYVHRMDAATGNLTPLHTITDTENPSFLAFDRQQRYLYAVNEIGNYQGTPNGSVSAYAINGDGSLTLLNRQNTHGSIPAHLSPDSTNRYLLVANYNGGNISAFPIEQNGRLGTATDVAQHYGASTNQARQERPHAHSIDMDPGGRYVLVSDLGIDRVMVYRFDASTGRFTPNSIPYAQLSSGAGPRHLAFHPSGNWVYVINELDNTLSVFRWDGVRGAMQSVQTVSTLPEDFNGVSNTAEVVVHPSGRFVYGSNRGHDSIAMFAINTETGRLTGLGQISTEGQTPRNIAIEPSGMFMYAANQVSSNIVPYLIDQQSGMLTPTGANIETRTPVCLIFKPV
jgi:6-phosphogluconolactonase